MDIKVEELNIAKHKMSTFTSDMLDIAKPLYKIFDLRHFSYKKIFPGRKISYLTTTLPTFEAFLQGRFYKQYNTEVERYCSGIYLFNESSVTNQSQEWFGLMRDNYNLDNGLIIVEKRQKYVEVYYFATTPQNTAINHFYINHPEIFKNFCLYFKDKAQGIISIVEQDKIIYSDDSSARFALAKAISPREYECVSCLARGKTYKEVAKVLGISPRTVEAHIINAKSKTNIFSTAQLIEKYWQECIK